MAARKTRGPAPGKTAKHPSPAKRVRKKAAQHKPHVQGHHQPSRRRK